MASKLKSFFLENTSLRQTVFKNTFWLSAAQVISRIIRAAIIIYAARLLGASDYGVFSYALSLVGFFTIFADLGLTWLLTREASKPEQLPTSYLLAALFLKLLLVLISMALLVFVAPLFITIPGTALLLPIAAFVMAFDSLRIFFFSLTRARQIMQTEAFITILTNTAIAIFALIGLASAPSSKALMFAYALGTAIGFLIAAIFIGKEFIRAPGVSRSLFVTLLRNAWPFALMGILAGVMVNMDTLMLGWFMGSREVGLYGAAQRPILLLYAVPTFFSTSLFPLFAKYAYNNAEKFRRILETSLTFCIAAVLPIVVGGVIVARELTLLIYGPQFSEAAVAFRILLLTLPAIFTIFIVSDAIVSYNGQKKFFIYNSLGALSDIILNLILIPKFGIMGAALSTVATQIITGIILWRLLKRHIPFSVLPRLNKIFVATFIMGIAVYALSLTGISVVFIVIASCILYAGLLFILKEPLIGEVKAVFKRG